MPGGVCGLVPVSRGPPSYCTEGSVDAEGVETVKGGGTR